MSRIIGSRSVLAVQDLEKSTRFYMDVLGFQRDFGDGSDGWSFLSRDGYRVMLGECADSPPARDLGDHSYFVYLTVEGLDELYQALTPHGVDFLSKPANKPWGMREFGIRTPDGHRITFGQPL
jgi:catechol 2,3-dioxygenase-like lactoylglutathione lyase family enzyme